MSSSGNDCRKLYVTEVFFFWKIFVTWGEEEEEEEGETLPVEERMFLLAAHCHMQVPKDGERPIRRQTPGRNMHFIYMYQPRGNISGL